MCSVYLGKNYLSPVKRVTDDMWYVYILKCQDHTYYVGITQSIKQRFEKHMAGKGAIFTKRHKPIKILKIIKTYTSEKGLASIFENNTVIEYAKKFGPEKVGGGCFNKSGMLKGKIKENVGKGRLINKNVEAGEKYLQTLR